MRVSTEKVSPGPLRALRGLLREWTWLNREIARTWGWEDCPWWCNERASISTLAGAVWNSRGIALEEYASRKRKVRGEALGRCDLYFKIGKTGFVAEAKHCWLRAGIRAENLQARVSRCLSRACRDARKNSPSLNKDEILLGIAFIVPRIPRSDVDHVGKRIVDVQNVLEIFAKKKQCAIAWIFPRNSRKLMVAEDDCIYPGIAVLIQRVR